jgi:negative regulator of replication initiation
MKTIEIDDTVYAELVKRVTGFGQTPNDVLRIVLGIGGSKKHAETPSTVAIARHPLIEYLESADFKLHRDAEGKYLAVLSWLYQNHKANFPSVERYGRGNRLYFATSRKKIEENAPYATVKQIPETPYFAMTTLDNKAKRQVLAHALTSFGYPRDIIEVVVQTIPSGSRANRLLYS